jgi:hypothetical protein
MLDLYTESTISYQSSEARQLNKLFDPVYIHICQIKLLL